MTFPPFKARLTSDPETIEIVTAPDLSVEEEQRLMHLLTHAPALYESLQALTIALETGTDVEKIHALAVGLTTVKRATWDETTYQQRIKEEHLSWEEKKAKAEEEADREYQAQLAKDDERRAQAATELTQLIQVMGMYDPPYTQEDFDRQTQSELDRAREKGIVVIEGEIDTSHPKNYVFDSCRWSAGQSEQNIQRRLTAVEAMNLKPGDQITIVTGSDVGGEFVMSDTTVVDSGTPEDDLDDPFEEP